VLVSGGIGTLGRQVIKMLRRRERYSQSLSRRPGGGEERVQVGLTTGTGLTEAVEGVASGKIRVLSLARAGSPMSSTRQTTWPQLLRREV
jgi:hypothetical protein